MEQSIILLSGGKWKEEDAKSGRFEESEDSSGTEEAGCQATGGTIDPDINPTDPM